MKIPQLLATDGYGSLLRHLCHWHQYAKICKCVHNRILAIYQSTYIVPFTIFTTLRVQHPLITCSTLFIKTYVVDSYEICRRIGVFIDLLLRCYLPTFPIVNWIKFNNLWSHACFGILGHLCSILMKSVTAWQCYWDDQLLMGIVSRTYSFEIF